jgi:hypothetical protein
LHALRGLRSRQSAQRCSYIASPADTEKVEADEQGVGTIFFTAIKPEFRGPVRLQRNREERA